MEAEPCKKAGGSRGRSGCSGDPLVGVLEHSGLEATDAGMGVEAGCTAVAMINLTT